ncbi:hypothetical protein K0M31_015203 [Melipona bicolor]|uniref:Uncharacterized protein n=1 Tax=Melipona bicolor TaxID=60889 RepID=A0AA40FFN6_9HYME|nr:hypothetical protein K0M31_015203 [Melipona bicolor]
MFRQILEILGGNSARSGMSVGPGGRAPFKQATATSIPITNKPAKTRSKFESKPSAGTGKKRDVVTSLFSPKRPTSKKVERLGRHEAELKQRYKGFRLRDLEKWESSTCTTQNALSLTIKIRRLIIACK